MAGSWNHVVDEDGNLYSNEEWFIENLGDAYEFAEEAFLMIQWLAEYADSKSKLESVGPNEWIKAARENAIMVLKGEREEAMQPKQFIKKPVVIEAFQWLNINTDDRANGDIQAEEIVKWIKDNGGHAWVQQDLYVLGHPVVGIEITTLEGNMVASNGDWIIKGVMGEFYPCKPEVFGMTYEGVNHE